MRCEKCKQYLELGDIGVRVFGRIWHPECAAEYAHQRKLRKASTLGS